MSTKTLREKRAKLVADARAMLDKAETEKRELTGEENQAFANIEAEIDRLKGEIDRHERLEASEAELRTTTRPALVTTAAGAAAVTDEEHRERYKKAFRSYCQHGMADMPADQREILRAGHRPLTEQRAQGLTAASGGYTIPTGFVSTLEQAMKDWNGVRQLADVLRTDAGNLIPYPTVNDTANVAVRVAEATAGGSADASFGVVNFNAYMWKASVLISMELLQDSAFNLDAILPAMLGERLGRGTEPAFTTGTGSSQEQGVVTASVAGKVGLVGQTTSVIADDLIDLQHSIDPAYRRNPSCGWMMHDLTLAKVRKLKDAENRYLWQPGLAGGAPDTILGNRYVVNNSMAQMAANAKSILFGDFRKMIIRDVQNPIIVRAAERYIELGQVAFFLFSRHDSRLIDAGTNPIKHYANSAT